MIQGYKEDQDIISIESNENGEKDIHIMGYFYINEDGIQCCEYGFAYIDIFKFEKLDTADRWNEICEAEETAKMWQDNASGSDLDQCVNEAYPECLGYIGIDEINSETTDGIYIIKR